MKHVAKYIILILTITTVLCSCSLLGDELTLSSLTNGTTTTYKFYKLAPSNTSEENPYVEITYRIGDQLTVDTLPTIANKSFADMKPGYKIDGWAYHSNTNTGSGTKPSTVIVNEDGLIDAIMVTPQPASIYVSSWSLRTIYYTFNLNGGASSSVSDGETKSGLYGTEFTIEDPVRENYKFTGWSPALPSTYGLEDTTFEAQWVPAYSTGNISIDFPTDYNSDMQINMESGETAVLSTEGSSLALYATSISGNTTFTSYIWIIDGTQVSTDQSLTITYDGYDAGVHTILVYGIDSNGYAHSAYGSFNIIK